MTIVLRCEGQADGIRFGMLSLGYATRRRFYYDRLNGTVHLFLGHKHGFVRDTDPSHIEAALRALEPA